MSCELNIYQYQIFIPVLLEHFPLPPQLNIKCSQWELNDDIHLPVIHDQSKKKHTTTYNLFFLHSLNHLYHVLTSIIIHASSTSSSSSTFSVIHHHHHWSGIRTTPDPVEKWLAKILACIYSSVFLILNIFFFFYNEFGPTPWGIAVLVIHPWHRITNTAMQWGNVPAKQVWKSGTDRCLIHNSK